jgi:hypothetical protein
VRDASFGTDYGRSWLNTQCVPPTRLEHPPRFDRPMTEAARFISAARDARGNRLDPLRAKR